MTELLDGRSQAGVPLTSPATLAVEHLTKSYSAGPVLDDVSLEFRGGEVHAIVGENGAGKSTLIKSLTGIVQPEQGVIKLRGERVWLPTPHDALRRGISVVLQEFNYCPALSVTENLFLGRSLPRTRFGLVDWGAADEHAREVLGRLSVKVNVHDPIGDLSPALRKLVEIGRALVHSADVLIMDEPTAALGASESERLFEVIRTLRGSGVAVVYVSHRIEEVIALADRISVLRDGRHVATRDASEASVDDVVQLMVGRPLSAAYPVRGVRGQAETVLEVRGLTSAGAFRDVSLEVGRGEILGVAGLEGSGRSELLQALAGSLPCESGDILLAGRRVGPGLSVFKVIDAGIAYVPPDRQHEGLHLAMSISGNVSLPILRKLGRGPMLDHRREAELAQGFVGQLDIRAHSVDQEVGALSGGNQQKVVLAKWLAAKPKVLLLDEPTRGVDVGAKSQIHDLIRRLAADGTVIILASGDLPEVMGISDRIAVLRSGRLVGLFESATTSAEQIALNATTGSVQEPAA